MSARTAAPALPPYLPLLSRALVTLALAVARWDDLRRTRRALAHLDGHILDDIGLSDRLAREECAKPFWRD